MLYKFLSIAIDIPTKILFFIQKIVTNKIFLLRNAIIKGVGCKDIIMSEYKKDLDFAIELMGLKKLLDAESRFISLTKEFPDEIEPYFYLGDIEF